MVHTSSILLQNLSPEDLVNLIHANIKFELDQFKRDLLIGKADDELLTREEACKFFKIDQSTLWSWTNKGKVKSYGIGNRRYYKRSELLQSLIPLKTKS